MSSVRPSQLPIAVFAATYAVVALLTIPHGYNLFTSIRRRKGHRLLPDGRGDGHITIGKPPRSLWQRICLVLVAAVATIAALGAWLASTEVVKPTSALQFVSWAFVLFQEVILVTRSVPRTRYNLGLYSALSTLVTGAAITVPNSREWYRGHRGAGLNPQDPLTIIQLVAAAILLLVNLALPRGPSLYRDRRRVDAQHSVSFLSRYTFSWACETLSFATKHGRLDSTDLPLISHEVRAQNLYHRFVARDATSLPWRKLLKLYWREATVQVFIQFGNGVARLIPKLLLLTILQLFEDRDAGEDNQLQLWLTSLGLGLSLVTSSWLTSLRDFVAGLKISLPVNEQLFAVIIAKAMALKDTLLPTHDDDDGEREAPPGSSNSEETARRRQSIFNLLGVDVEKISGFLAFSYLLLDCVFGFCLTTLFLVQLIGWKATVAGCVLPILLMPVYYTLTVQYSRKEQSLMDHRDHKSSLLAEMVHGIRQIKLSALEAQWFQRIQTIRGKELQDQLSVFRLNIALTAIWTLGPICMGSLSIVVYVSLNGAIFPSTAFTVLSLFENLQNILSVLPEVFTDLLDTCVSLRRISHFLRLEDHADRRRSSHGISLVDATIAWPSYGSGQSDGQFHLKNLNIRFPLQALSIISGCSGAGKSLLLQALIGEADIVDGVVTVPRAQSTANRQAPLQLWGFDGTVAYVSQGPWIENATIRDSVLFGLPWNQTRYNEVIHACAMLPDLELLPESDRTDIGANGINLSGGQRWRLALARALYSRASVLVLDDIFSAVDSHVGRHLYNHALNGTLANGRTVILATHHVKLCLASAAYWVELDDGAVVHQQYLDNTDKGESTAQRVEHSDRPIRRDLQLVNGDPSERRDSDSSVKQFYEEEKRETGVVDAKVYKAYINASGGWGLWIVIAASLILLLLLTLAVPYWVSLWTRSYGTAGAFNRDNTTSAEATLQHPQLDKKLVYYASVYVGISIGAWLIDIIRITLILNGSIEASRSIFEQLSMSVLRAPLSLLDVTPGGQILNRFTSDFNILDSNLALDLSYTLHDVISILGVIVAALLASPLLVWLGVLALLVSWRIGYFYVTGAREAKRLESVAKSPIFDLVGSLLTGLPTIRAFGREQSYLDRMYGLIDRHCQALWHRRLFSCWMSFWLSFVGAVFVASVATALVTIHTIDAPLAGFALSFALNMSSQISMLLTQYARLEMNFNSAERIVEYTHLEQEPQSGEHVPAGWPTRGELELTDLTVAYTPSLSPVLRNLHFSVRQGERVGIVGRTGAGKSSLVKTLMRCLDIRSGTIHIDGVDISRIRLHDLRSRIEIISQEPILFAGTVREVLDPFNQHCDSKLRKALENVSLYSPKQPTVLDDSDSEASQFSPSLIPLSFFIAEGGQNLSQGQQQLLCLARALVSQPKILIMDEATASIDMESDIRIQRVLREEISGCTLIVIAHRLSTIADFDRVVVLEAGEAVEVDTPRALIEIEGGMFRGLVEESGERSVLERMIAGS
ncbi:P-loop containing nucleoside triphosphate hydrolase protein [Aspergillus varians]